MTVFKLPDLGEGLPDAEIREWHVDVGDNVETDQPIVSMETAKAVVEVPAPFAGIIKKLYGEAGDVIETGAPLIEFEGESESASKDSGTVAGTLEIGNETIAETATVITRKRSKTSSQGKATPAVRALAQRLDVDLSKLSGSGPNGLITVDDVKKAQKTSEATSTLPAGEPLKGSRRIMAQTMTLSHQSVVPVTIFDEACLTHWTQEMDLTARLVQAIYHGIKQEPALNTHFDGKSNTRLCCEELKLGIAMDSDEGLFVPVLNVSDEMQASSETIRQKINLLKSEIKARTLPQEQLKGATFTLSNFGMFAGRFATPIVVPPQVAILGTGRLSDQVIVQNAAPSVVKTLPLSLTFDHRAVTGGEATRFLGFVIKHLEEA